MCSCATKSSKYHQLVKHIDASLNLHIICSSGKGAFHMLWHRKLIKKQPKKFTQKTSKSESVFE